MSRKQVKHLVRCLISAARRPRIAALGVREFRTDCTTSFDYPELDSYDSGRELAHMVTLRRYDWW
jgi:hypothetical protein